jgi:hypothetical protein
MKKKLKVLQMNSVVKKNMLMNLSLKCPNKEKLEFMKKEIFNLFYIGKVSYFDFDSFNFHLKNWRKRKRNEELTSNKKTKDLISFFSELFLKIIQPIIFLCFF